MRNVDLDEGCTTRIGSSHAMPQVQAGEGADHHRRRSVLNRDLGSKMSVVLGVEVSRTVDFYQPGGRSRGGGDYYEGYSAADSDAYRPRHYSKPCDTSSQQQQQQQQQPYDTSSSSSAASPSPDPGTSAPAAPLHFAEIAHRVRRGKAVSDRPPFPQTETIVQH